MQLEKPRLWAPPTELIHERALVAIPIPNFAPYCRGAAPARRTCMLLASGAFEGHRCSGPRRAVLASFELFNENTEGSQVHGFERPIGYCVGEQVLRSIQQVDVFLRTRELDFVSLT